MNKTKQSDYWLKEIKKGYYKIFVLSKETHFSSFESKEEAIKFIRKLENNDRDVFKGLFVILMLVMLPFVTAYAPLSITLGYSLLIAGLLFTPNKPSQTSIFIKSMGEV